METRDNYLKHSADFGLSDGCVSVAVSVAWCLILTVCVWFSACESIIVAICLCDCDCASVSRSVCVSVGGCLVMAVCVFV